MQQDIAFEPYLTSDQRALLERSIQIVAYRKGQMIHRHGDACVGLIFVRKGRLAFSALSEEGREITIFRAGPGQACILSAACVFRVMESESHITAEVDSEVAVLPAVTLSQLMNDNKDVERIVYKAATQQYASALKSLQQIVFFSLEKRLAIFLYEESQQRAAPVFSTTHEQIARCIGSSREVVTRMLNQFAAKNIVALGRGTVTILDETALEEMAT